MTGLQLISVQPDFYCVKERRNDVGGPFCARCKCGVREVPGHAGALLWCLSCGLDTGRLPEIEIPPGWGEFSMAYTFTEARRLQEPGFIPGENAPWQESC